MPPDLPGFNVRIAGHEYLVERQGDTYRLRHLDVVPDEWMRELIRNALEQILSGEVHFADEGSGEESPSHEEVQTDPSGLLAAFDAIDGFPIDEHHEVDEEAFDAAWDEMRRFAESSGQDDGDRVARESDAQVQDGADGVREQPGMVRLESLYDEFKPEELARILSTSLWPRNLRISVSGRTYTVEPSPFYDSFTVHGPDTPDQETLDAIREVMRRMADRQSPVIQDVSPDTISVSDVRILDPSRMRNVIETLGTVQTHLGGDLTDGPIEELHRKNKKPIGMDRVRHLIYRKMRKGEQSDG